MDTIGSIAKSNAELAGAPILGLVLLGLESLLDKDFICPSHQVLGIIYSVIFVVVTTAIITIFLNPCWSCRSPRTRENIGDMELGAQDPTSHRESKCCKCCKFCTYQNLINLVTRYKGPIFWVLILITDGRFGACCVESARGLVLETTTQMGFLLQTFQVIGLVLILLFLIILLRMCEPKSRRYKYTHKENILQCTNEALQEQKKKIIQDFVNQSIGDVDWNAKLLSAEVEWEEIADNNKKKVINNLHGVGTPTRSERNADMSLSIIDAQ